MVVPRIDGAPDFEIKQKFTKAIDLNGSSNVEVPWYNSDTSGRAPDTIEFRFKTPTPCRTTGDRKIRRNW